MKIQRHIAGGTVVIAADHRDDTYIDARPHPRRPGFSRIDFVRSGTFMRRECVSDLRAPERIIEIARGERL